MRRIFLVGTDTDCGKTTVACALLRASRARGVRALPFKPAASGAEGAQADPERLVEAAGIAGLTVAEICPLRYAEPVAPGLAEPGDGDMSVWTGLQWRPGTRSSAVLGVLAALAAAEGRYAPALTIVEGAGGLWVPMPGGTWQPAWISGLAATPVVVGRLGLGTINHCLLTITALRELGLAPLGFILTQNVTGNDPSQRHNERVIAAASGLPCLGVLAFGTGPEEHGWVRPEAWSLLE